MVFGYFPGNKQKGLLFCHMGENRSHGKLANLE